MREAIMSDKLDRLLQSHWQDWSRAAQYAPPALKSPFIIEIWIVKAFKGGTWTTQKSGEVLVYAHEMTTTMEEKIKYKNFLTWEVSFIQ